MHVVRASQRERLLEAMLASVAERGYAATTVPQVVADAHVSRNAFYELFRDKTDCFIALCDELAGELFEYYAALEGDDWVDLLRQGMSRYLRFWAERPAFARTYFVELPSAGPRAIEQRDRQYARFRALFEELARLARPGGDVPPLVPRLLVVSITELVAEEVRAGRAEQVTGLEDELVAVMVQLLTL